MDELMNQVPENMTYKEVETIFLRNDKNIIDTLTEIWNIPIKNVENVVDDNKKKWDEIREVYDSIDREAYKMFKKK
jgi:hypothetical protein|tara:strand:- start:284 stop:511 length:228 start_codon:yes stop_codon:yes gene_type:complete